MQIPAGEGPVAVGVQVLRVATDFEALLGRGLSGPTAVQVMRERGDRYDGDQLRDDPVGAWLDAAADNNFVEAVPDQHRV